MNLLLEDIEAIMLEYDIGDLVHCSKLSEGTVQSNYKLTTTKGDYVLKYYTSRSYTQVLFEYTLMQFLIKKNFPTAAIVNTKNTQLQTYKPHPYIIFNYVEGQHIGHPNKCHINQIIKNMGLLHSLTENMTVIDSKDRLTYSVDNMIKLVTKKAHSIGTENARSKLKWWLSEAEKLVLPDELTKGICHTDYNPTNIVFLENNFKALIDFDDANYTYRCFDIISFINFYNPAFDHDTWQTFNTEDVLNFSDAKLYVNIYDDTFPMSEVDKYHLYDLLKFVTLIDCVWYFERGNHLDFYERRKMDALNGLGRDVFYKKLFID